MTQLWSWLLFLCRNLCVPCAIDTIARRTRFGKLNYL